MGIVSSLQAQSNIVMKILLVLAVAAYAKAEAEADPGFVYSTGALPLAPALTYAYNPVVYTVPAAGCQNSEGAFVPCAQGNYFGYVPVAAAAAPAAAPAVEEAESKKLKLTQKLTLGYTTAVSMDMVMDMVMLH